MLMVRDTGWPLLPTYSCAVCVVCLVGVPADAPGRPQDVRVLEAGSRQVKLTWLAPQDDRGSGYNPTLQYSVQIQQETEGKRPRPRPRPRVCANKVVSFRQFAQRKQLHPSTSLIFFAISFSYLGHEAVLPGKSQVTLYEI